MNADKLELLEAKYKLKKDELRYRAKSDILAFTKYTKEDYLTNWHHQILCDKLNKFARGEIKRMMVFMPPQHGKSELTSRRLPAFMLGLNPNLRIALCAYNSTFASKFNRQIKRIMTEPSYNEVFPETTLSNSKTSDFVKTADEFEVVNKSGSFISVGVGGGITGNPVDIALIDDPIKGAEEAGSQTYREKVWEWYTTELSTRLNNNSQVLLTLTRWNVEDIAGKIIEASKSSHAKDWEIVTFPRIKIDNSNPNDPREIGEVLWEEMHSYESAMEAKQINPVKFEALQQQNPKIMEAGSEFYKAFNQDIHVTECQYNEYLPLHISLDENVNPYITATLYQVEGNCITQIDELCLAHPKNTVRMLAEEFMMRYPNHKTGLFIYGDATSQKADTKLEKGQNFFTLFCKYIEHYYPSLRVGRSNPSVAMRGNWINDCFETDSIKIRISEKCHNSIADFQFLKEDSDGTKSKKKIKDIRTGISYEQYGHCFIAGTKIKTILGDKNIEDVKLGDYVLTRKGYKPVFKSGLTRKNAIVRTYKIGNNEITCTPDHKIFTNNQGFKSASTLIGSNTFCIFTPKLGVWKKKRLSIMDLSFIDMMKSISGGGFEVIKNIFIDIFGNAKKTRFPKNIISIIKMVVSAIIILPILFVLMGASIYQIITKIFQKKKNKGKSGVLKNAHDLKQLNGINQKKEESGTRNTLKNLYSGKKGLLNVLNVVRNLLKQLKWKQSSVQQSARIDMAQGETENWVNGMNRESVFLAVQLLRQINGVKPRIVQESALQNIEKRADVYDLTVKDQPEFFANNILVHNCSDTFDYMITQAFQREFLMYQRGGKETKMVIGRNVVGY